MKKLFTAAALILLSTALQATPLYTFDSSSSFRNGAWSFGEIFTVGANNINVTALGAYDDNLDGFVTQGGIEVGLFLESDSSLLASTFVQSTDALDGFFRFADIANVILTAGTQYRIVANNMSDNYNRSSNAATYNPAVTYDGYGYCTSSTMEVCNSFTGNDTSWMANLQFGPSTTIPEPAGIALLALGLFGLRLSRKTK